jgi:gp16 family phage-associated protein
LTYSQFFGKTTNTNRAKARQTNSKKRNYTMAKTSKPLLSPEEARAKLDEQGLSIAKWAVKNGLNPNTVSDLLNGRKKGVRGESHNAAVLLGLKHGKVNRASAAMSV